MNAIVALCHFCDLHGPCIVFCTQPFHSPTPDLLLDNDQSPSIHHLDNSCSNEKYSSDFKNGSQNRIWFPTATQSTEESSNAKQENAAKQALERCEGCRSIPVNHSGFISSDRVSQVSYVSSQQPYHPQVYSMVRQACVRSLSCEVCPGREGPIFFGDNDRGHVFSYTFSLQDTLARGLARYYSIIVVMMDKVYLLNSFPYLEKQISSIINELKNKSIKVYEQEQCQLPARTQRFNYRLTPIDFRRSRSEAKPARSLMELTGDTDIFSKLHSVFTMLLKVGGSRLKERLLEAAPTEDSIIDMEMQEETEEGFLMLFSKKMSFDDFSQESETKNTNLDEVSTPCPCFDSLHSILQVFGEEKFFSLAHNIIIGNQLIIRGEYKHMIHSLIKHFQLLLPKGCCRPVYYSDHYQDSWKCNFLGLSIDTPFPRDAELYAFIDIFKMSSEETTGKELSFKNFKFDINISSSMFDKLPTILSKMKIALLNKDLSNLAIEQCFICLKEEWMNKVKVLFKFTKAGGSRSESDTKKLLQIVGAMEEDKAVLKFWMTGLSNQHRNHMLSTAINKV